MFKLESEVSNLCRENNLDQRVHTLKSELWGVFIGEVWVWESNQLILYSREGEITIKWYICPNGFKFVMIRQFLSEYWWLTPQDKEPCNNELHMALVIMNQDLLQSIKHDWFCLQLNQKISIVIWQSFAENLKNNECRVSYWHFVIWSNLVSLKFTMSFPILDFPPERLSPRHSMIEAKCGLHKWRKRDVSTMCGT